MLKIAQKAIDMSVEWLLRNGYPRLASTAMSWGPTRSGATVNEKTALLCSTVWACTRLIAGCLENMPAHVYRGTEDNAEKEPGHWLYPLVHDQVNDDLSAGAWRNIMQGHALIWGNGYSQIVRRSGSEEILGFHVLTPDTMRVEVTDGRKEYVFKPSVGTEIRYKPRDIFHLRGESFDGIMGYSLAKMAAESIGIAMSAELFAAMFYGAGGRVPGTLEYPGRFKNQQEFDEYRGKFDEVYSGQQGFHKTMILESGMKWSALGVKPQEMQFVETRSWMVSEICRWFGVSPHLVGDLSRATFSNIEHLAIEFVNYCIGFWQKRWVEQYNLKCIPRGERDLFIRFDSSRLTRGDFPTRMAGYASGLQNGVFSVNEVRALEGKNPIEGGDIHRVQLNMQDILAPPPAQIAAGPEQIGGTQDGTAK
jgi:HK97 family phage portal protein